MGKNPKKEPQSSDHNWMIISIGDASSSSPLLPHSDQNKPLPAEGLEKGCGMGVGIRDGERVCNGKKSVRLRVY